MIDVQIRGVRKVLDEVEKTGRRVRNVGPALNVMANLLEIQVERQFATSGRRAKTRWKHLATRTTTARIRRWGYYRRSPGPRSGILQWTGGMRRSFKRGGKGHIRRVRPTGLHWGSQHTLAEIHQKTRPILKMTPRQESLIVGETLRLWIEGQSADQIFTRVRGRAGL